MAPLTQERVIDAAKAGGYVIIIAASFTAGLLIGSATADILSANTDMQRHVAAGFGVVAWMVAQIVIAAAFIKLVPAGDTE